MSTVTAAGKAAPGRGRAGPVARAAGMPAVLAEQTGCRSPERAFFGNSSATLVLPAAAVMAVRGERAGTATGTGVRRVLAGHGK
jgi:hypothetical protein